MAPNKLGHGRSARGAHPVQVVKDIEARKTPAVPERHAAAAGSCHDRRRHQRVGDAGQVLPAGIARARQQAAVLLLVQRQPATRAAWMGSHSAQYKYVHASKLLRVVAVQRPESAVLTVQRQPATRAAWMGFHLQISQNQVAMCLEDMQSERPPLGQSQNPTLSKLLGGNAVYHQPDQASLKRSS